MIKRFLPFLLSVCILVSAGAPVLAAEDDYGAIPATADSYIINGILSGLGLHLFSSGMSVSELDAAIGDLWALFRQDISAGAWEPDPSWNTSGVNFFSVYSDLKAAIHSPNYVGLAAPVTDVNISLAAALYVTVHPVIYNSVLAFRDWYVWKYMGESDVVSVISPSSSGSGYYGSFFGEPFLFPDFDSNFPSWDSSVPFDSYSPISATSFDNPATLGDQPYVMHFTRSSDIGLFFQYFYNSSLSDSASYYTYYSPYAFTVAYSAQLKRMVLLLGDGVVWRPAIFKNYVPNAISTPWSVYSGTRAFFSYGSELIAGYLFDHPVGELVSSSGSASLDIWDDSDPVGTPIDEPSDVPVIIGLGDLVGSLGDLLSGTRDFVVHSIEVGADAATNIRDALQGYIDKVGAATDDLAVSVPGASSISLQGTIVKAEDVPAEIPTDTPSGFTPIIPIPDLNLSNLGTAFRSIWHYIEEWLATFRSGISWMFNLYSYLPYAIVVPLYAGIAFALIFYILKKVGF